MVKRYNILLLFFISIFLFIESSQIFANSNRKPKWIIDRPIDNDYYIGIGKSNKSETNTDYLQIAKNSALADMISEISVQISSNSILYQIEDNKGYKEKYEAQIEIAAKDDIEGYEVVDTWENKNEYWVYYRLSKAEYQRKKREKLEHAKNISKDFFEKAQSSEKEYDIHNALIYYIKAFDAIEKHLGEDLSVFTFDGRILLDNAIYQSIQSIFRRITISPEKQMYTLRALSSENEPVFIKVKFKTDLETQNLANIPIRFSFPDLNIPEVENVVSMTNGKAECTIANMVPKGRSQIVKAELNTDFYFGESSGDNILKILFTKKGNGPFGNINIVVQEIFAYIESEENIFEKNNQSKPITNFLKEELSENFFSFTEIKANADVVVKINSSIVEGAILDKLNLHTVFLNCYISIWNVKTNLEIYQDGFSELKGMKSGSFQAASQDALLKAKQKIKEEITPNIRKINL